MSYIENLESVGKKIIVEEEGLKITEDAILLSEFIKSYFNKKYKGKNIEINDLNEKIIPINENIKKVDGEYDFIFSNPPYKKTDSGKMSQNKVERISKYEVLLTLEELILEIRRLLKNYGEFFIVIPNSRLNDIFRYIYENKLNILSIKINKYKKVDLVVVHGKKGGKINSVIEIK